MSDETLATLSAETALQMPTEVTHNMFFLETFGEKRFAIAFLKKVLPPKTQNIVEPEYLRLARLIWLYLVSSAKRLKRSYEQFAPEIHKETGDNKMQTMVEVWRAEGRVAGEARGEARGAARTLLRILKKRFNAVPQSVDESVMATAIWSYSNR